jgi:hypothetical protein
MWRVCVGTLLILGMGAGKTAGQDLSTVALPSADEAYEALVEGDIDYEQYLDLVEIIENGTIRDLRAAMNELPNLADFIIADDSLAAAWPFDELAPVWRLKDSKRKGILGYQYYSTLENSPGERYRISVRQALSKHWRGQLKFKKEIGGKERFVGRQLVYHSDSGAIREVSIGSFNATYGLGTVVGYRTKYLKYDGTVSCESFLFPDAGGFNGVGISSGRGPDRGEALISVARDTGFSVVSCAAIARREVRNWSKAIIIAANQITNRKTGDRIVDTKCAVSVSRTSATGRIAAEYCAQLGYRNELGTIVLDGNKKVGKWRMQFSAWNYGPRFLDFSSGSKAAAISHKTSLEDIEFELADKRTGQRGMLLGLKKTLKKRMEVAGDVLIAARSTDSTLVQFRPRVDVALTEHWKGMADFVTTAKQTLGSHGAVRAITRKIRGGIELERASTRLSAIMGHTVDQTSGDYLSLMVTGKHELSSGGSVELWSNLGKYAHGRVQYWYGFVRTTQPVWKEISLAAKLMLRYRRTSIPRHQLSASVEVSAAL